MNSFEGQNISRSTAFEIKNKFSAPTKRSDFLNVQIKPNHLDESDFFALHESLGEGLAIVENGRIVYCTKLFCKERALNQEDFLGKSVSFLFSFLPSRQAEKYKNCIQESIEQRVKFINFKYSMHINGETLHFHDKITFSYINGTPKKWYIVSRNMSDEVKTNNELETFKAAIEQSEAAIIITDSDFKITYVNKGFRNATGYKAEEAIGKKPQDAKGSNLTSPSTYVSMHQKLNNSEVWSGELINEKANGETYEVKALITPVINEYGGVTGYVTVENDISPLIELQEQLRRKTQLSEAILNNSPALIAVKNNSGEIIYANDLFLDFISAERSETQRKSNEDFFSPESAEQMNQDEIHVLNSGNSIVRREHCVRLKNGKGMKWLMSSIIPLNLKEGCSERIIIISEDISSLKLRENDLQSSLRVVNAQKDKFKEFTYLTAHNLRSQVTNLVGIVNLLENDTILPYEESVPLLRATSSNLLDTITYINSMLKATEDDREFETIPVLALVHQVLDSLKPKIQTSQSQITIHVNPEAEVFYNLGCLESTIFNLVSNAIKFRSHERENHVTISFVNKGDRGTLSVEDNGMGLDTDFYSERIFRLGQTFHEHPESRGVGLFIVRNHLQSLGGDIEFHSTPGKGSKLVVTL